MASLVVVADAILENFLVAVWEDADENSLCFLMPLMPNYDLVTSDAAVPCPVLVTMEVLSAAPLA